MLMLKKIGCGVLAALGISLGACHKSKFVWETEDQYFKLPMWNNRVKEFNEIRRKPGTATLFIGDSITEGYDLQRMFGDTNIINMGIGGDFTSGILMRLEPVKTLEPRKIFIMIGINDITKNTPLETTISRYGEIIDRIHQLSPQTKLYVQSNLPTRMIGGTELANALIVEKVKNLNAYLKNKCQQKEDVFIDLYSSFQENDVLIEKYTYDGLHISEAGYQLWTSIILPMVKA